MAKMARFGVGKLIFRDSNGLIGCRRSNRSEAGSHVKIMQPIRGGSLDQ